jgi:hypothetical protein
MRALLGFEPTISAGEGPQAYALDREATGTRNREFTLSKLAGRPAKKLKCNTWYPVIRTRCLQDANQTDCHSYGGILLSFCAAHLVVISQET